MENINCSLVTGETNLTERRSSIEKFKDTKFNIIDSGVKHGTVTLVFDQLKQNILNVKILLELISLGLH